MNRKPPPFPFEVPEQYFEQSAEKILRKMNAGDNKRMYTRFHFRAASIALVLASGAAWMGINHHQAQQCQTFTCLLETTETEILEAEMQHLLNEELWNISAKTWPDWIETDLLDDVESLKNF